MCIKIKKIYDYSQSDRLDIVGNLDARSESMSNTKNQSDVFFTFEIDIFAR